MRSIKYVLIGILLAAGLAEPAAAGRDLFADTMRLHFRAAEVCLKKRKNIPSRRVVEYEINAIRAAAIRHWPTQAEEAQWRLMTLMLTEGGGSTKGAKADPSRRSYGPLHIKFEEAKLAAEMFKIGKPFINFKHKNAEKEFRNRLRWSTTFAVECGAAYLKMCDNEAAGDWQRGLLMYKYGSNGYKTLVTKSMRHKRSLDEAPVWTHFTEMRRWIDCIMGKAKTADDAGLCNCAAMFEKQKGKK
jgi:hypothetical protein